MKNENNEKCKTITLNRLPEIERTRLSPTPEHYQLDEEWEFPRFENFQSTSNQLNMDIDTTLNIDSSGTNEVMNEVLFE